MNTRVHERDRVIHEHRDTGALAFFLRISLLPTQVVHTLAYTDLAHICTRLYVHTLGLIQRARTAISGMRPFFLHGSFTPFVRTDARGRHIQRDIHW